MKKEKPLLPPLHIVAYSDSDPVVERRPLWGDYWLKEYLTGEFKKLNYPLTRTIPGVLLHLFGKPLESLPEGTHKILWHHSHPDWITPQILSQYHKIYCVSRPFIGKLKQMGFEAEWLMIPTRARPIQCPKIYDIVFVGNARRDGARRAIQELADSPYHIKVWGTGWNGLIPDKWLAGSYYANQDINKLYAAAKIVVNDHHEDMRREGFINPRILDVLASGSLVISDYVTGMEDIFEDSIPVYRSPDELRSLVKKYLCDNAAKKKLIERGRQIAVKFSYSKAAVTIVKHIEDNVLSEVRRMRVKGS
ncbi:MAG: glycosyltransferase [Thermodesulfobacteriota bacterium]|nr:glycosyltransferase [Thermodesulfobacteriota bacterium]